MTTELTLSDVTVTIPALGDSANIVTAFTDYHTDMAAAVAVLARSTNTFTGDVAVNGGDITTTATTATLFNTNATTLSFGGAATTLTIGATSGTATIRNSTVAITNAATIGTTLAVTGNTTLTGDLAVNGGDLTSSASTFNLLASPTTVNFAAAGTALTIGATTGTTTIRNATVAVTNALTVGTTLAVTGNTTLTGDLAVNGADITTTATGTAALFNTNATTLNIGGAATTVSIGATTGTTTVNNDLRLNTSKTLIFEGSTDNVYETILTVTDPTADRTVTFQNATGTVALLGTIALGTDTTGNYVASVATGSGLSGGASGSEGAAISLGIDTAVVTTLTGSQTLTNKTITGLSLTAGTNSVAPLVFNSGTNLTNPLSGRIEYDGNLFYATPKVNNTTAGRGVIQTDYSLVTIADNTQTVTGTANTDFYALGKSIYLAASQAYFVEMSIRVYHNLTYSGLGSGGVSFLLKAPTNTSFMFDTQSQLDMATLATEQTPEFEYLSGLGVSKTIKSGISSSDQGYNIFKWSGIVYVGTTAGNFGPALNLTSSSTFSSSFTVKSGSYCKVTPLGTYASEINHGGWA